MGGTRGALLRGLSATETFEPQFIHLSKSRISLLRRQLASGQLDKFPPNADQDAEEKRLQTDSNSEATPISSGSFSRHRLAASDLNCVRGDWRLARCD